MNVMTQNSWGKIVVFTFSWLMLSPVLFAEESDIIVGEDNKKITHLVIDIRNLNLDDTTDEQIIPVLDASSQTMEVVPEHVEDVMRTFMKLVLDNVSHPRGLPGAVERWKQETSNKNHQALISTFMQEFDFDQLKKDTEKVISLLKKGNQNKIKKYIHKRLKKMFEMIGLTYKKGQDFPDITSLDRHQTEEKIKKFSTELFKMRCIVNEPLSEIDRSYKLEDRIFRWHVARRSPCIVCIYLPAVVFVACYQFLLPWVMATYVLGNGNAGEYFMWMGILDVWALWGACLCAMMISDPTGIGACVLFTFLGALGMPGWCVLQYNFEGDTGKIRGFLRWIKNKLKKIKKDDLLELYDRVYEELE